MMLNDGVRLLYANLKMTRGLDTCYSNTELVFYHYNSL
jgi:hypothetical protein